MNPYHSQHRISLIPAVILESAHLQDVGVMRRKARHWAKSAEDMSRLSKGIERNVSLATVEALATGLDRDPVDLLRE